MNTLAAWASYLYTLAYETPITERRKKAPSFATIGNPVQQPWCVEPVINQLTLMIRCILGFEFRIRVVPHPILDDPDNLWERVIIITNGLRPSDDAYQGVVLRVRLTRDGHLLVDTLECTDGVTFDIPTKHQKIQPVIKGRMVHSSGLVYAELDNHAVGPYFCTSTQPTVRQAITDTVQFLKSTVDWDDDVFDESDDFD